jgi:hypothetical protein
VETELGGRIWGGRRKTQMGQRRKTGRMNKIQMELRKKTGQRRNMRRKI